MKCPSVLVLVAGVATMFACKPAVVVHPDAPKVSDAQKGWCTALARFEAPQDQSWRHVATCNAATPTGSAAFVAKMTECYTKHHEAEGENALDLGGLVARCTDEVLGEADAPDALKSEPIRASCARMERCQKVSPETCLSAVDSLAPMQKVGLTSAYSLAAQHAVAECLAETVCADDEDKVRTDCYRDVQRLRVWMPPM